jgi:DNA-binding response OmpR family regulator
MLDILKNYTILYVEDEPSIRDNIVEFLSHYFYKVYTAKDGKEALNKYKSLKPDALLLDISIPYIDGLTLAKDIRKIDDKVKILILTGHTDLEKLLKATELKLVKYLIKPTPPKLFKDALKMLAVEFEKENQSIINFTPECYWSIDSQNLFINKQKVELSTKSKKLLNLLIKHKNSSVSYEDIMVELWEDSFDRDISIASVKNQVSILRKQLPINCIDSVYKCGYILSI